jgi:hypothetical protein
MHSTIKKKNEYMYDDALRIIEIDNWSKNGFMCFMLLDKR